MKTLKWQ